MINGDFGIYDTSDVKITPFNPINSFECHCSTCKCSNVGVVYEGALKSAFIVFFVANSEIPSKFS